MRDKICFLVFDGFADWQAALALCEVRRPGDWQLQTVGFSTAPVTSMGGLKVQPDLSLAQMDLARVAMLILPGGHMWTRGEGLAAVAAARRVHNAGAPVAGIDGGVLALARAGLLDHCRHTANHPGYIDLHVPDYRGTDQYDADVLAVSDGGTLTASQLGSVEFAREVIRTLDLYNASDREHWYRLYKHALPPPWLASDVSTAAAA